MAKVGFISLGCPKNQVDSEVMVGMVRRGGHEVTPVAAEADVLVVNTCGFVSDAKKESIDAILEAAQLKESGRCRRLVVTGCLPERYASQMRAEFPEVDVILGTNQVADILRAVEGAEVAPPDSYGKSDAKLFLYDHETPRALVGAPHAAYMKIAEGCDHACAFCVIPKIRGRFRSRTIPSLVAEARHLAQGGVREVTLVAQDTTGYGKDLGMDDGLADLLAALEKVEGIGWIRFLYAYPDVFSDRLIGVIRDSGKVCRYVDMPLQHASADLLRAMRRGGSRAGLERMIDRIRKGLPGVTLRTTFIVGFPGETRRDFIELQGFCRDMEFDRMGVFAYSDEEDTPAHGISPKVSARTAERRRRILMEQQEGIAARKNRQLVGKEFKVLVEGPSEESELLLQGRLESQAPEIDGVCLINDIDPDAGAEAVAAGDFRTVKVTKALGHDLLGRLVRQPR
ncbi:MAG: 30S ribosomal protein S12 methylthiotransferase RimO [Acidobacteriota bacterium]|nr:30S ribosomal protein S12 methylthiotransferase RimO [Acidobacteriota bacterium]